jgi:NAD(P)-dependent dehydrogenase (short-subunit alcohol dehydrogenase family)
MSSKHRLSNGCRTIITGASSGIGRSLAVKLAKDYSAKLILNARNEELLSETAKLVKLAGGQAEIIAGDISNKTTANKLAAHCMEKFGGVDLLVNNDGLTRAGTVSTLTPEDWEYVFGINFFGSLYAIYAVLPHMLQA